MRKSAHLAALAYCACGILCLLTALPALAASRQAYVVDVQDGCTITTSDKPGATAGSPLRLYGIGAPTPRQPMGPEARAELRRLLPKGTRVEIETVGEGKDDPPFALVQVRGASVNYQLVVKGLAWVDRKRCKGIFCRRWYLQERQAVEAHLGIWGLNIGTPPWQWGERR